MPKLDNLSGGRLHNFAATIEDLKVFDTDGLVFTILLKETEHLVQTCSRDPGQGCMGC